MITKYNIAPKNNANIAHAVCSARVPMHVHDFRLVPVSYFGYQMLVQYIIRLVYTVIIIQLSGACSYDKN